MVIVKEEIRWGVKHWDVYTSPLYRRKKAWWKIQYSINTGEGAQKKESEIAFLNNTPGGMPSQYM